MKKLLICLLCCLMFVSGVSAQINKPTIDSESRLITISGKSASNSSVIVMITKPEIIKGDVTTDNINEKIVLFSEVETDENGVWYGQFTLPEGSECGKHMVYVNGEADQYFYYADTNEINEAVSAVDGADADTLAGILKQYTITKEILAIDLSGDYAKFSESDDQIYLVHRTMLDYIDKYGELKIGNITEAFDKAIETANYIYGDADDIKAAMKKNNLGITIDYDIDADSLIDMYRGLRSVTRSASDIEKELRISAALIKINNATKGEMTGILEDYNDVLELDLDGDYEDVDKIQVNKKLVDKGFSTLKKLQDAFDSAVEYVENEEKNEKKASGGGGGRASGSVTSTISVNDTAKEDTATDKEEIKNEADAKVTFTDIKSVSWAKEYIEDLAAKSIINGVGNGEFAPMNNVTREQFLKMLMGAFGVEVGNSDSDFDDVDSDAWYAPYITWAVENGIVNGIDTDTFGVGMPVSREQMAVMCVRMLDKFGNTLSAGTLDFSDADSIELYAKDAVAKIQKAGIINGMPDGSFAPKSSLTRAQAAKVICLVMKVGEANE